MSYEMRILQCLGLLDLLLPKLKIILDFQSFDFERARLRLLLKRVVRTEFDRSTFLL